MTKVVPKPTDIVLGAPSTAFWKTYYLLVCNKNIRFDFDDELQIRDVRYDSIT